MQPSCPSLELQEGKNSSSTLCFPTLTSPAHPPEKGFAEFANCLFSRLFSCQRKSKNLARVGREQVLSPNCCNSLPNPAITSPWDTQRFPSKEGCAHPAPCRSQALQLRAVIILAGAQPAPVTSLGQKTGTAENGPSPSEKPKSKHSAGQTSLEQLKSLNSTYTKPGKIGIVWYLGGGRV